MKFNRTSRPSAARNRRIVWPLAAMALLAAATPASADDATPIPPRSERAPEIRLAGEIVTLPIVMVQEFPFIEGSIAGVSGKLMFDTGNEQALTINDHRVPISGGRAIGTGFFGSGQTFTIRLVPELRDIVIGGLAFPSATLVTVQDARLLERITPDFIGWVGHHAFAGYALKLDYRALTATFYRHVAGAGEGREPGYLQGEQVIAELPFETRTLPNHPIIPGRIGEMEVTSSWDTGQQGSLYTTAEGKARLLAEGLLIPWPSDPDLFDLHGVQLDGHAMPVIRGIDVATDPSPSAAAIGITETHRLSIGYGLLHQFKTVWDYELERIYLLAR
jgi:opacity protein-like surface antigen